MKKIQAIKGMNDLLPIESPIWRYLEASVSSLLQGYGYQEIRFPIMEKTELFKRSIGEVTDIVEKEMYTFDDRNGESMTLRPEGTASCLRACEEHQLLNERHLPQKLWYAGPMFRYEKPQKGRLRQFHQIGVETYGLAGPDIDAELMLVTSKLWELLGIQDAVTLEINTLGTPQSRATFRDALVDFLKSHLDELDEDSKNRIDRNPMRVLDSKDSRTQALLKDAPNLLDYLDDESKSHFDQIQAILRSAKVDYTVNSNLVRGLDYYTKTVFEWKTNRLGAQGTVCAGGRYDGLVEQLGGKPTPAVGFAMGIERLILLIQELNLVPAEILRTVDVYFVVAGDHLVSAAFNLCEKLRGELPDLNIQMHLGGGSIKSQMKKADKSGADMAFILGENEHVQGEITVKYLRAAKEQITIKQENIKTLMS